MNSTATILSLLVALTQLPLSFAIELSDIAGHGPVLPPPPALTGNPLVALASALVRAILYLFLVAQYVAALVTITVPTIIVRVLQYSFTISLGFPHFLALFIGLIGLVFVIIRYRYLTRYTQLKESALPLPSPPTLTNSLPLIDDPALVDPSNRSSTLFHSYLDDFLSAIRIFGYLEKPVFHELSRHLQTRRLAAGDTIDIGGGDFWCVVEGRVQVFAPSSPAERSVPSSPDPFGQSNTGSFNGYNLINEVSTGGTLSSLFSILSLFTEDIKLSWTPNNASDSLALSEPLTSRRRLSRANSDVSQLDGRTMGLAPSPDQMSPPILSPTGGSPVRGRASSVGTAEGTLRRSSPSPGLSTAKPVPYIHSSSQPVTTIHSPIFDAASAPMANKRFLPQVELIRDSSEPTRRVPRPGAAMKGTIARATVDTTLAVIPAEAFRKLTRKFPKAAGSIVQVVLERFSRVTFMTAHKFLGLTREILRSEAALNSLVSHPLPASFYTGGGMQALRSKFQPEEKTNGKPFPSTDLSPSRTTVRDYFSYEPTSPTVRAPSLPSVGTSKVSTPAIKRVVSGSFKPIDTFTKISDDPEAPVKVTSPINLPSSDPSTPIKPDVLMSPETAVRHSSTFIRRTSAMRKQVAAGDLAMSHAGPETGDTYYRPTRTPGIPRMDTWRGQVPSSTDLLRSRAESLDDDEGDDQFELRDAVVLCIAKSIGLSQPPDSLSDSQHRSLAPSASLSTPNSPMFPANSRAQGQSRTPFSNVLDMMNASGSGGNIIGGMLRESLMGAGAVEDDMSSVSASMHDSLAGGGLPDVNTAIMRDLGGNIEVLFFKKGSVLVKQGERAAGTYYVIDGFLDVSIPTHGGSDSSTMAGTTGPSSSMGRPFGTALGLDEPRSSTHQPTDDEQLFTVKPGGIAGYLSTLCGTDSYVNITAKTDCYVGFLPRHALERIIERRPIVLLTLAKRLLSLLSPLVLHIDAGLDWIQLGAGQILYEKGDKSTDFYIVINGRLRSLAKKGESIEVIREYGQNDSIGELDVITGVSRSDTVQAIRETELVRIPAALFDAISVRHPATTVQFMRLIASKVRKAVNEQSIVHHPIGMANELRSDRNLKTVCVIGTNRNVPVAQFAGKLKTSLEEIGALTSYLDQATVMRHLGRHAFARIGALKIAGWLADQEQHHRMVLYVVDTPPSSQWTMTCIRQADLVLILGMGDDPSLGEYEKLLLAMKLYARKELILLHDERAVPPGSTRLWLKNRPWLQAHYHVELPGIITKAPHTVHDPAAVAAFKHLRERVETRIKQYRGLRPLGRPRRPPHMNDFARIARRLCDKQVGLVLGGGGARGISHIGMLQALEEYGIPVDAIAGCSIGSFVGGLYARETDLLETTGRTKQFAGRMGSMLRVLSDVTYPYAAYTTGHEFNRGIYKAFYNTHIEDFWIPFFANSTNITHSRMEIHRSGYAWRYVRASMTLAGFLPPLSDNGNLLVDGGYMDNTPMGPLRASGINDIIVVDVGSIDDTSPRNYGDSVSGWWIFLNRFNPFFKRSVLSMTEVSSRLTYVSSVKTLEEVKSDPSCLYLAMPVQHIETLGGFKRFSEVLAIGLETSREMLKKWKAEGRLPHGFVDEGNATTASRRGARLRRSSI